MFYIREAHYPKGMNIRFDYIVVALTVTLLMIGGMWLLDYGFTSSYNAKYHQFDAEFANISAKVRERKFAEVIRDADLIIRECGLGSNDIRAKVYKVIAKTELGSTQEAIGILNGLVAQYPGIETVYGSMIAADRSPGNIHWISNHILNEYLDSYKDAVTNGITPFEIVKAMDVADWLRYFFVLTGSLVVYERIRKRMSGQPSGE